MAEWRVSFEVPLEIEDPVAEARGAWPVTSGVPFARGRLAHVSQLRLVDPDGTPMALQAKALSRWPDGSVQWALLDFVAPPPRARVTTFLLQVGAVAAPSQLASAAVAVKATAERVAVDTGPLQVEIGRAVFEGLRRVSLRDAPVWDTAFARSFDLEHAPPGAPDEENWQRDAAGGARDRFDAHACPQRIDVEEAGPIRATIRLHGCHANAAGRRLVPYDLRVSFHAGQTSVRVLDTFMFDGDPRSDFVRRMSLRLGPVVGANRRSVGLPDGRAVQVASGELGLTEIAADVRRHLVPSTEVAPATFAVRAEGRQLASGIDAPGWADVSSDRVGVTVAVRDFARQHPKGLRLDADGAIAVELWPEGGGKVLDLRRRSDVVDDEYHYDLSLSPSGGRGLAKTHEIWLDFHQGRAASSRPAAFSRAADEPIWALASPAYVADTGALGRFLPRDPERFPRVERSIDFALAWLRANQRTFRWDGLIDYGDVLFIGYEAPIHRGDVRAGAWGSRGYDGWLNDDGELVHSLFLHALRGRDRRLMLTAEAMVRHVMDVDTCHYDPDDPGNVGGGHRHDQQHWGNHIVGYGTASQGILDHYLLTGDGRALEVARENASFHQAPTGEDEARYGALSRFASITGDERARDAADRVLAAELGVPAGRAWPFATPRHFRFVSITSAGFVLAEANRPDARLGAAIVRAVDGVADELTSDWRDPGYAPQLLVADAYRRTRDPRYVELAKAIVHATWLPPAAAAPARFDGLSFAELARIAPVLRVNNLATANLTLLCGMPYLLGVLADARVGEAEVDAYVPRHDLVAPFTETLDPRLIRPESGRGLLFLYDLTHGAPSDARGGPSTLQLFEDGRPLGPAHAPHAEIRSLGRGRFSHWGSNTVRFSTSDGTDPRTNGRTYHVRQP